MHFKTPKPVIVCATEDSWSHTINPRLVAAGADLTMVYRAAVKNGDLETGLVLPWDLDELNGQIREIGAAMVLLDPLMSRLDSRLDTHKDADVRTALEPIVSLADESGAAVVGLIHVNKSGSSDPLTGLMGSRAFAAVARSVLYAMSDPNDETGNRKILGQAKNSLGRSDLPLLAYEIHPYTVAEESDGTPITTGQVRWLAEVPQTSLTGLLLTTNAPAKETAADRAVKWLRSYLTAASGRVESSQAKKDGVAAGHTERTLQRAVLDIEARPESEGFPRRTYWILDSVVQATAQADQSRQALAGSPGVGATGATGPSRRGSTYNNIHTLTSGNEGDGATGSVPPAQSRQTAGNPREPGATGARGRHTRGSYPREPGATGNRPDCNACAAGYPHTHDGGRS